MTTMQEAQTRRDAIEELIRGGRWSLREAEKLAKKWKISKRTVLRYKADLLQELVDDRLPAATRRQAIVASLEGLIAECRAEKDRKSVVGAYRLLAQLEGVLQVAPEVSITINPDRADPLALLDLMRGALSAVEGAGLLAGPVIDVEEG